MTEITRQQMLVLLPRLRRFGYALSGTWDQADDLVQTTYERAIGSLSKLREEERLDAWMFQIMRNQFLNQRRTESLREKRHPELMLFSQSAIDGTRMAETKVAFEKVRRALGGLPENQRTALILVAVEGFSYRETAELMSESLGTIASRVARAREALKPLVQNRDETEIATELNDSAGEM